MRQVFVTNGQFTVPTEPSVGALLEEVSGLADEVRGLDQHHPLIRMWAVDSGVRAEAYRSAQEVYGLPYVTDEEREKPQGLIFFWSRIRDLLESDLVRLRKVPEPCSHPFLVTAPHREGGRERGDEFISPGEGPYDSLSIHPLAE